MVFGIAIPDHKALKQNKTQHNHSVGRQKTIQVGLAISLPQPLRLLNPIKSKTIAQAIRASPIMSVCTLGSPSFLLCLKLSINVTSERAIIMANTGLQPIQNRLPIKNAATPAPHREYMIMPVAMSVGGMLTLLRKRILYS